MKRGNLLWIGSRMMLSEHRQLLNKRLQEVEEADDLKRQKDEQQLEEWQEIVNTALAFHKRVVITLNNEVVIGYIVDWNIERGVLYIQSNDHKRVKVSINQITDLLSL